MEEIRYKIVAILAISTCLIGQWLVENTSFSEKVKSLTAFILVCMGCGITILMHIECTIKEWCVIGVISMIISGGILAINTITEVRNLGTLKESKLIVFLCVITYFIMIVLLYDLIKINSLIACNASNL